MTLDEIRAAYSSMTLDERRDALPAWFTGQFDPTYPERHDLYGINEDNGLGHLIATEMAQFERALPAGKRRTGITWNEHEASMQELVEACRIAYLPIYHEWLERNAPEGSRWRPHHILSQNYADSDAPEYDYTDYAGQSPADILSEMGHPTWASLHSADFQKLVKPGAGRRPSKDGWMANGLGIYKDRPIGTTPMGPIFSMTRGFYFDQLGLRAFRPEYPFADDEVAERRPLPDGREPRYTGEQLFVTPPDAARAATIKRDEMNTAAKFLSLVLKEVDVHFNARQSGLVARAFYRRS